MDCTKMPGRAVCLGEVPNHKTSSQPVSDVRTVRQQGKGGVDVNAADLQRLPLVARSKPPRIEGSARFQAIFTPVPKVLFA
jgi:hypothetical protein